MKSRSRFLEQHHRELRAVFADERRFVTEQRKEASMTKRLAVAVALVAAQDIYQGIHRRAHFPVGNGLTALWYNPSISPNPFAPDVALSKTSGWGFRPCLRAVRQLVEYARLLSLALGEQPCQRQVECRQAVVARPCAAHFFSFRTCPQPAAFRRRAPPVPAWLRPSRTARNSRAAPAAPTNSATSLPSLNT